MNNFIDDERITRELYDKLNELLLDMDSYVRLKDNKNVLINEWMDRLEEAKELSFKLYDKAYTDMMTYEE